MTQSTPADPYLLQKIALLPAANSTLSPGALRTALLGLEQARQKELVELIIDQGLQFFWLDALQIISDLQSFSVCGAELKESCVKHTARYLSQKKNLMELDTLLNSSGCLYAAYKGAQVREAVYDRPAYRPSVDIDILINPDEKKKVLRTLVGAGYSMHPHPANISHEISLVKDAVDVDLHWNIMRPGRTRCDVVKDFLLSRQRQDYFWGLDAEAALFIMLVHPVFTKYSTAPQSAIVRLVDICKWLDHKNIEWPRLIEIVEKTGMKTASWLTLTVFENLTGRQFPGVFSRTVIPLQPKRGLLQFWLRQNLSARLMGVPAFIKYFFTLLAHDSVSDALNFVYKAAREKNTRQEVLSSLEGIK